MSKYKYKLNSSPGKQGSISTIGFPLKTYFDSAQYEFRNDNRFFLAILLGIIFISFLSSCSSSSKFERYDSVTGQLIESGEASWYGPNFHGRQTANGEIYNQYDLTAAHRTLKFDSIVRVVNKSNGKSVVVRINDRGPYAKNRIIDLSRKAAEEIDMIRAGYTNVDLILLNNTSLPQKIKQPHYTVQVGSYKRKSDAIAFSRRLRDCRVVDSLVNGESYYRVYVGEFTNKYEANELRKSLQDEGYDCFVKQVEN